MKSKKELKDEYLQSKSTMGIFQIKNLKNGKILIDASTDIKSRINRHKIELKLGSHQNKELLKDWKEFGEDSFEFKSLSEIKQKDDSNIDYKEEIKILKEMVIKELQIRKDECY